MKAWSFSSSWTRSLVAMLASQGLDVESLLADVGLSAAWLQDADRRWPAERIDELWRLAQQRSGNPNIGLAAPDLVSPGHYGIVGYAMMSSPDLKTCIGRLIRYQRIVSDEVIVDLVPDQAGQWATIDYAGGHRSVPRQRVEYGLLVLFSFCRWVTGRSFVPVAASFRCPEPPDDASHRRAYGCPLRFDQSFDGFLISTQDLEAPLPTATPELNALHDHQAALVLHRLGAPTSSRAQDMIVKRLQDGTPRRSQIAADLGLSDRTFQRRLDEEATSFSDIVDRTRRELAHGYLRDPRISLSEIVYLLGYTDQSPFHRACLRWFSRSPGEYRDQLTGCPRLSPASVQSASPLMKDNPR
ncbi:MAG: AraC family transcriptional regulator [Burkholderiaceae bacterium]